MKSVLAVAILCSMLACAHAQAAAVTEPRGTKVNLDARAAVEVDNDVMRATLFVEMEDADSARLADKVNRATNEGLKLAKGFTKLRAKTSGYTSYPVTDKNKIVRWRSRSEIALEGEDFRLMAEAIGKLQAGMQLGAVDFSVSPAARARAEDGLTQAAIAEFLRKAEMVTKGFRGGGFDVLEANVSSEGGYTPPRPMVTMKAMSDSAPAAPTMEGGTTRITIVVNGSILIPR
jgi:predicted secreted protein